MKIRIFFAAALLAAAMTGCKSGAYETTKSGVQYELHSSDKSKKVENGDLVSINYILTLLKKDGKDTVLANTNTMGGPEKVLLKESKKDDDIITRTMLEILPKMGVGDSASFIVPVDSLDKKLTANMPILKDGGNLKWEIKVAEVMSKADYHKKQEEAKTQIEGFIMTLKDKNPEQAAKDSALIEDYLKKNNLTAQRLPSGLYYIITKEGSGETPLPYQIVSVDYKGYLMDGTVFDNSFERGQPISFPLGVGQVIPGWDQGLMLFKPGTEGKLLIPSYLGYGERANEKIPANAVLIFDIHLVDVK